VGSSFVFPDIPESWSGVFDVLKAGVYPGPQNFEWPEIGKKVWDCSREDAANGARKV